MKQPQSLPCLETTTGKSNIYIPAVMMNILVNEIYLLPVIRTSIQIVNGLISISYYKTATFHFHERNLRNKFGQNLSPQQFLTKP